MFVSVFLICDDTVDESTLELPDAPMAVASDLAVAAILALEAGGYALLGMKGDGRREAAFLARLDGSGDACVTVSPERARIGLAMEAPMAS